MPGLLLAGLLVLSFAGRLIAGPQSTTDLIAHEWGTFTAIAGKDGAAVEWTPFIDPSDLPRFVEHYSSPTFKLGLRGTIRMETPVLYFYSSRDVNLSVNVAFAKGIITEWYPRADRVHPRSVSPDTDLSRFVPNGSITWSSVAVSPNLNGDFPQEPHHTRYYAARETSSAPLLVKTNTGNQLEKFLFYRGVSSARLPVSARQTSDGKLTVKTLIGAQIPAAILFERRGERVGDRIESAADEMVIDPPLLTGSVDTLAIDLEGILVEQGLYPDEAHAMVETWKDSWFEEGSRLIYVVPRGFIDKVLPLTITPSPDQIVRVFVGRFEIVTPATTQVVQSALTSKDEVTLNKYRRFLEPIERIAMQKQPRSSQ